MSIAHDPAIFRRVLGHYPTGVCVVTAAGADGARLGMVVGSFSSASLDPPLVAFFPDRGSTTWPRIAALGRFCVNVLAEDQVALCRTFASRREDKFADVPYRLSGGGAPILDGIVAWIDCTLHAVHDAGDHHVVLGAVTALDVADCDGPLRPLLFYQGGYGRFDPAA